MRAGDLTPLTEQRMRPAAWGRRGREAAGLLLLARARQPPPRTACARPRGPWLCARRLVRQGFGLRPARASSEGAGVGAPAGQGLQRRSPWRPPWPGPGWRRPGALARETLGSRVLAGARTARAADAGVQEAVGGRGAGSVGAARRALGRRGARRSRDSRVGEGRSRRRATWG